MTELPIDISTVGVDHAVLHESTPDGVVVHRFDDLPSDTDVELLGVAVRTLAHPGGALLDRFATVNDVHFGETEAGLVEGHESIGPIMSVEPGEAPYPETMNQAAIGEIAAVDPTVVVAKGDLTTAGTDDEYAAFLDTYGTAFGDRLLHVRGNHDAYHHQSYAAWPTQRVDLRGVVVALLDTTKPGASSGQLSDSQIDWLDSVGSEADRPVLVFGHHHVWDPGSRQRPDSYFGIHPDWSERLIDVFARRPALRGYFAGHTHRNRVRRFSATGDVPFVEVACVKDFPGSWAEYQVFEGGVVQLHHRISTPEALAWSERCRGMYFGAYSGYALGELEDRCFVIPATPGAPPP